MSASEETADIAALMAMNERLLAQLEVISRENKILREEIALLKKGRFGRSSERIEPGQLSFFEGQAIPDLEPRTTQASKPKKKPGHGRAAFPDHLPRTVVPLELDEDARTCSCGEVMQPIGVDVSERGRLIPARLEVTRFERTKYACPHGHGIKTAELPGGVIDSGKYDASVYAHIAVAKYQDHLPLNRLESIFKRYGFKLPKQTMWDMVTCVDELVAQPVLAQMHKELLQEDVLHADETSVTLRLEDKKGSKKSWVFGWRSLREHEQPKALVEFRMSRGRDGPTRFLGDWSGTLITDGYAGYNEVCETNGIRRAGCWAHARRKFKEALDTGSKDAAWPLFLIGRLFALERAVVRRAEREGMGQDELVHLRREVRARRSRALVERIHEAGWDLFEKRSTLPKSKLGKAVKYLANQREYLDAFLDDARIPIHNNDSERDMRHVVTGRKNWLVFASPKGGEVACRLISLMLSCRQNGVNPEAYIADVLMAVATTPSSKIASLTPWAWGAARKGQIGE